MESQVKNLGQFAVLSGLPELAFAQKAPRQVLRDEDCYALWDKYAMPENIRRHSRLVAHIAQILAELAMQRHFPVVAEEVRCSALLHDLGKSYSLRFGGSHSMLGAGWVVGETHCYGIAKGVMHHVNWPWPVREDASICQLPILVMYADKRVSHDQGVTLAERFQDLEQRYGISSEAKASLAASFEQILEIERILAKVLGWEDLHAYSFNSRRLVY